MEDDFDYEKLTRALDGALPPAAALAFVEAVRRMTPERRRNVGRIMRGKARWSDWLGADSLISYRPGKPLGDIGAFEVGGEIFPIVTDHPPCKMFSPPVVVAVEIADMPDPLAPYRSGELSIPDNEQGRMIRDQLDRESGRLI